MSGCLKTSVEYGAKLFRLPVTDSRQGGLCSAWKARGVSVKEVKGRKPRGLATSCYHRGHYPLGGGEGHREWLFAQWKYLFSLQDSLGQTWPEGLAAESQPVSHRQGGWVGCVYDRLSAVDWVVPEKIHTPWLRMWIFSGMTHWRKKSCVFSGKSVRVVVLTLTPFSKIPT